MQTISTTSPGTLVPARRGELARLFGAGRVGGLPRGRVEADQRRRQLDQLLAPGGNLVEDALLQRHGRR